MDKWIKLTYSSDTEVVKTIKKFIMDSRENSVNFMTPLGLHNILGKGHHFGPRKNRFGRIWICRRKDWKEVKTGRMVEEFVCALFSAIFKNANSCGTRKTKRITGILPKNGFQTTSVIYSTGISFNACCFDLLFNTNFNWKRLFVVNK